MSIKYIPRDSGYAFNIDTNEYRIITPKQVTAYDIPISHKLAENPKLHNKILLDIRKKMTNIGKQTTCDINRFDQICEIRNLIKLHHRRLYRDPSFNMILEDIDKMKQDFIAKCKTTKSKY